ncbi:hypothetical protein BC628DRAFT_1332470 [Trametes gibbosa]|nr:hypothetical protein BC628DRAFT_1332470 [Trametes gibbosa]
MLTTRFLPLLLSALLARASSLVSVSYKLDDQLPPIARIHDPYTWAISNNTFLSSANTTLTYSASSLPAWLSFDPGTRTLHGTPDAAAEGSPRITITATDPNSSDSASTSVTLCVTPYPPPELHIPIEDQFTDKNPSLSSVFLVPNTSALYNSRPALRVPPKWSYSIGFQYNTFTAPNSLYYAATQADGSPLPGWVNFNERAMTFGGVTPHPEELTGPRTISVVLHASDQEGYSAASVPFDLVVAAHDMTLATPSLPTINVTVDTQFELTLNSAVDFTGVLIDDEPLAPSNITVLDIDTAGLESWLRYNDTSKTLSGQPPSDFSSGILPVVLTSSVNQTLQTTVTIAAVPSFFSTPDLQPMLITPGSAFSFDLAQYFSNSSGLGNQNSGVNLTAAYDPSDAGNYLNFDSSSAQLTGTIPSDVPYSHVAVTFTAYSRITHSTSHTTLPLSLSTSDYAHQHNKAGGLSTASRAKLVLGLKIAFGIISAFVAIAIAFAVLRRCTYVPDSAVVGEEARRAWTDAEMRWYGIGIEVDGEAYVPKDEEGYGWTDGAGPSSPGKEDAGFGMTLSRVLTRTFSNTTGPANPRSPLSPAGLPQSPGLMKKVEFLGKLRTTARIVSDKYRRVVSGGPKRPVISKPTLIMTSDNRASALARQSIDGLPMTNDSIPDMPLFEASRYAPSGLTSLINSPSSSTDARSVPRRRADFAPPRMIAAPAAARTKGERQSMKSVASSFATSSSSNTHEAEAVVQRATRAVSVRSALSCTSQGEPTQTGRPRLVPFTSAARVPVPKLPSSFFSPDPNVPVAVPSPGVAGPKRVASQMAKVFRNVGGAANAPPAESADELRTGIEYVRALGDDGRNMGSRGTPAPSICFRGSSHHGHDTGSAPVPRMLARVGERFRYRLTTTAAPTAAGGKAVVLVARLATGRALPRFMKVDLDAVPSGTGGRVERRVVELSGVPIGAEVGELEVGVYVRESGECVGRVVVEVVERKTG